ncbi:MAG: hypothetical protein A2X87_07810 [Deltaproteobacteria bacterium GWC2_42_51]|nr:MAG: hypothetical protein A2X87_07810 [Deltaproteobacteria bacterium GWC2_42_51]OGQ24177.1 MAG: hypothetical protein A3D29_02980 [Deltaproteobacteria bacterium RIFCSPHIGHO2_02_FULL_42_44]OGQ65653.1 MAG: hypothetical protein A3F88_01300 [Deltaproteobacteria bacterium RIFCSPLOWO2_12_FULL_42_16]
MFFNITILFASIGLILATVSFISGLQAIKAKGSFDTRIHRLNGYLTIIIYILLAGMSLGKTNEISSLHIVGWSTGLSIILTKIWIVRKGKTYKYASWMGMLLIITWLIVVYTHIPV